MKCEKCFCKPGPGEGLIGVEVLRAVRPADMLDWDSSIYFLELRSSDLLLCPRCYEDEHFIIDTDGVVKRKR